MDKDDIYTQDNNRLW